MIAVMNRNMPDYLNFRFLSTRRNKTIFFFAFFLISTGILSAQDSLNVKWVGGCLGSLARKAVYGFINNNP